MRKVIFLLMLAAPALLGQTAKRQAGPEGKNPQQIASEFMASSSVIAPDDLSSVYVAKQYTTAHNGVTHLVYKQRFQGFDVYNGAWVANIDADGRVLNTGGKLFAAPDPVAIGNQIESIIAAQSAIHAVNPKRKTALKALVRPNTDSKGLLRYSADGETSDVQGRMVWYAHRGSLLLAWVFNVLDEDGVSSYNVVVEAATGAIIAKQATLLYQAPKGLVFDQGSPQPNPTPGVKLTSAPPLVDRVLLPLTGDPVASPMGWVINNETAGNNAIVGENVLGQQFITTARRTVAPNGDFSFPLMLGPAAPSPVVFPDSANVNLFYWVNRAHDMFYRYGFDEAAGNFQLDNYGRGGAEGDPLLAYTHYGAAATFSPSLNNAFFNTRDLTDGSPVMIAMYVNSSGAAGFFADSAYAALTSTHEYTHGVSLRLLPDGYGSIQTGAMGEAWSDFFGLEFTLPEGSPADGVYPYGEYSYQLWGTGIRTRPYSTNMAVNALTFADYGHVILGGPEVHADGEIWTEALWDARANLIQQFGDAEGRRRIRQIVMDGLKLSPPSPSMVDARDAILLADQVDFKGASQTQLWNAFAKRGLGALAHSEGGDTVHVIPSFDVPSNTGKIKLYESSYVAGEFVRVLLSDLNMTEPAVRVQLTTTSGDVEDLMLARTGSVYYGAIPSTNAPVSRQNGIISIIPGDDLKASYSDNDRGFFFGGGPPAIVEATAATQQPYQIFITSTSTGLPPFPNETLLTTVRSTVLLDLRFDFPFFSKKYRTAVVHPNGTLVFEPSADTGIGTAGCTDVFELRRMAAVAPLLTQLTFGTAQPNEGVYVSFASNAVTIRWAAETLPSTPLLPPAIAEPVNVAVTLNADGVIAFQYGSGNQNLHQAMPTFSNCGPQPVVGISNGHDVYSFTVSPFRTYTNAPAVTLAPPFNAAATPEVFVETPKPDDVVRGVMRVSGIAYNPGGTLSLLSRRDVFVDGIERTLASTVSRPDYCATNTVPGCPNVGFQAELNLAALGLDPGPHTVWVRASNTRGGFKDSAPVSFNVDAAPARLPGAAIEAPAAGAEISGTLVEFRGYAYAPDLRVSRVDLLVDGVTYPGIVGASYGSTRTDICNALPAPQPPNCPSIGWSVLVNTRSGTPPLPDGPHSMQIRVLDETGRFTVLPDQPVPFTVKNGSQTPPIGSITSIKPNDQLAGVVQVSGYAYSPGGTISTSGVVLLVDGTSFATPAQYGLPRPVECGTLTGVAACPNIGFNVNLDTRFLSNGNHVIGVRITNSAGISVVVPNLARYGMNVVVNNP